MTEYLYHGKPRCGNRADIHIHTNKTDGSASYEEVIEDALKKGLHTVAITDHDRYQSSYDAWNYVQRRNITELTVLFGTEITTRDGHVLAVGVTSDISLNKPVEETLRDIHEKEGIAVAAHPGLPHAGSVSFDTLDRVQAHPDPSVRFDGIEVYNASAQAAHMLPLIGNFVFGDSNNQARVYYEKLTHPKKGAAIGGSDAHGKEVGLGLTVYEGSSLLEAIRHGETTVMYRESTANPTHDLIKQVFNAHVRSRLRKSSV